jgi:TRAP-type C4-dicarboxylate transport system permease small subunit
MSVMVISTLLQVFARVIDLNIPFTEELTIYAMMWVTMFGSAYTFGLQKQIAIDA